MPEAGIKAGTRVVKLKHFFGHRMDGKHKFTILAASKIPPDDRSFVSGKTMTYLMNAANPDPIASLVAADSDGVSLSWFTLAHELGHVMGLPDEYSEPLDLSKVKLNPGSEPDADPRMSRFSQRDEAYPFYDDDQGILRSNKLPRLRFYWHHFGLLNGGAKALLPEGHYVEHYAGFAGGVTHMMPDGNTDHPWKVRTKKKLTGNRATLVLYALGDDEATVEKMFQRPASNKKGPGEWMNGVVIVRSKIWFNFHASKTGDFADDAARWDVVRGFYSTMYQRGMVAQQRFFLDGPPGVALSRIAVVFQPLFEFGPRPTGGAFEGAADLVVDVVFQNGPPKAPLSKSTSPPRLQINQGDVGLSILRTILSVPVVAPATLPGNGPIVPADLADLAGRMEEMMSTGPGAYLVKVRP